MPTHIKQKSCPYGKGDYCTSGLKCTEQNCFLLKSSTVVHRPMAIPIDSLNPILVLPDNGRIRSSIERREFSYDQHIPERRSGKDRRSELDRRLKPRTTK